MPHAAITHRGRSSLSRLARNRLGSAVAGAAKHSSPRPRPGVGASRLRQGELGRAAGTARHGAGARVRGIDGVFFSILSTHQRRCVAASRCTVGLRTSGAARGGRGKLPPYGWTSKNYVIRVCFHCHVTSLYHTTNTLQGRRAKSRVDTQTIQPGLGDFVL